MDIIEFIFPIIFIVTIYLSFYIRKVPPKTVVIIDKNRHYYKTLRRGYYFLFSNRKVTTKISERELSRSLAEKFETYDGQPIIATITCAYKTDNLESVIESLSQVRRSIDDIILSSVYYTVKNFRKNDLVNASEEFKTSVLDNLTRELSEIGVSRTSTHISITAPVSIYPINYFKPHVSSHDTCNTTDYNSHEENDDPIKFY